MSRYGFGLYGNAAYGSGVTNVYDASPLIATPIDSVHGTIQLRWRIPDGTYTRLVLLRSNLGVPDNPDREVSTVLLDVDYSVGSTDPAVTTESHLDFDLIPGREYFYAIYVLGPDPDATTGSRWYLAASTKNVLPKVYGSDVHLRSLLPAAMFTDDGGFVSGPVEDESLLYSVSAGIGVVVDRIRTDLDLLLHTYDTERCPDALVQAMSQTLGIGSELSLPARANRALNKNAVSIFTSKGTADSIRLMSEALSGLDAYPSRNVNLLPNPFYSGFEIDDADIVSGILTAAPTNVSTMLKRATVSGRPGFPVKADSDPTQLDTSPVLATLTNSSGDKQHVVLLSKYSTTATTSTWSYVPSAKGTSTPSFGSGSVLRVNHNNTGWTASHGFVTEIETPGTGDPGNPPYNVSTTTEALFTPKMDWRLRSKRVATTVPESLTLRLAPYHNILLAEKYDGTDTLIVLEHPHTFQQGTSINVQCDQLSLNGDFLITRVIDAHRFYIDHRGTAYAAMNPATIGSGTTNIVKGPDYARAILVEEQETYTFSAWVRSNIAATVSLGIEWYEPSLVLDSTTSSAGSTTLTANTWTKVSLTGTSPTGVRYAGLKVTVGGLAVNDLAYLDNVQFELGSETAKYSDGGSVILQLATTVTSDPGGVLRLRMKERLEEVVPSGRTSIALLTEDESLIVAANSYLRLPFSPSRRFFQEVDPDTVLTERQDLTSLGLDPKLTYVPTYDPESVFSVSNQEILEVLIRADILATTSVQTIAQQLVEDSTSSALWVMKIQKTDPTTATLSAEITNQGSSAITVSGSVPYEADISRWYRLRIRATSASGSLSDGASITLHYAADSIAEPESWTSVATQTVASFTIPSPGDIRIGHPTNGAQIRTYRARVSRIAEFVANDYNSVTKTAPNDYGAFESTTWSLVEP